MGDLSYKDVAERISALVVEMQKEINSPLYDDIDTYESIDNFVKFYSERCKWEHDEFCVNDQSEWCADFTNNVKCGGCPHYEIESSK